MSLSFPGSSIPHTAVNTSPVLFYTRFGGRNNIVACRVGAFSIRIGTLEGIHSMQNVVTDSSCQKINEKWLILKST